MGSTDDLLTMLYWILGLILVIFIIDWVWLKPLKEKRETDRIIQRLRHKNTVFYQTLPKFKAGRGIVTVTNNSLILQTALLIATLRRLGCQLPVLACYAGDDLDDDNRRMLHELPHVETMATSQKLDLPLETLRGTQLRVYSLIYSPFSEVLLIEPDTMFFRNPEYLFDDPRYQQTGALFWKDRKLSSYWDKKVYDWVRRLIPYRRSDNRILDKKAGNYQSRSIIILNKSMHTKMLEKLWVLTREWETVYNYLPGDKETWWIAAELAKEDYTFVDSYPGVIGELEDTIGDTKVPLCGHTLYLDPAGQLLCWDDSIFENGDVRKVTDFTHYARFGPSAQWNSVLGVSATTKCLRNAEYFMVTPDHKRLFNEYAHLCHELKNRLTIKNPKQLEYNSDDDSDIDQ